MIYTSLDQSAGRNKNEDLCAERVFCPWIDMEKEMREDLGISTNFGKSAVFGRYYKTTGHKKFRGIIVGYFQKETTTFDSIKANYFDKNAIKLTHTYSDSASTDSMKLNFFKVHKYFEKDIVVIDSM